MASIFRCGSRGVIATVALAALFCTPSLAGAFCVSGACFDNFRPSSSSSDRSGNDSTFTLPRYTGPSAEELERKRKQEEEARERELQKAAESANRKGIEFAKAGNWKGAIRAFKEALGYVPGDETLTHNLNLAIQLQGKEKEAQGLIANQRLDDLEVEARDLISAGAPADISPPRKNVADTGVVERKAVAAEKKRLQAREAELDRLIKQDVFAIKRLGFDRRAGDFDEWVQLSDDARKKLEREAKDQALDTMKSLAQDKMIDSFKEMDRKRIERLIKWLKNNSEVPIDETINVLRQAAKDPKRIRMAGQAKAIVDGIDAGVEGAAMTSREEKAKFYMGLLCDVGEGSGKIKWCQLFKSEVLVTEAAVYNNAARRVSVHEVERLTRMTEQQLKALKKLNEVMVKHVKERNEVRARQQALSLN